jgi:hypothetical protein
MEKPVDATGTYSSKKRKAFVSAKIIFVISQRKGAGHPHIYSNRYGSHLEPVLGAGAVTLKEVVSEQLRPVV